MQPGQVVKFEKGEMIMQVLKSNPYDAKMILKKGDKTMKFATTWDFRGETNGTLYSTFEDAQAACVELLKDWIQEFCEKFNISLANGIPDVDEEVIDAWNEMILNCDTRVTISEEDFDPSGELKALAFDWDNHMVDVWYPDGKYIGWDVWHKLKGDKKMTEYERLASFVTDELNENNKRANAGISDEEQFTDFEHVRVTFKRNNRANYNRLLSFCSENSLIVVSTHPATLETVIRVRTKA